MELCTYATSSWFLILQGFCSPLQGEIQSNEWNFTGIVLDVCECVCVREHTPT